MMFKRTKANNGASNNMTADVYQRNGMPYRPPQSQSGAAQTQRSRSRIRSRSRDDRPAFPDRRPRQISDMTTPVAVAGDRPSPARRLSTMNGRPPYRSSSLPRAQVRDTHASPPARAAATAAGPTTPPDISVTMTSGVNESRRGLPRVQVQDRHASPPARAAAAARPVTPPDITVTMTSGVDESRRGLPRVQVQDRHASPPARAAAAARPVTPPDITVTMTSGVDESRRGLPRVQVQDRHASPPARAAAAAGPTTPPDITVTITSGADERRRGLISNNENEIEEAVELPSTTAASNNNASNTPSSSGLRRFRNPFTRKNGNVSKKKKVIRVYVPPDVDWQPGQKIRVLYPNKCIWLVTIPPRSKWLYERSLTGSYKPYFRMYYDPMAPIGAVRCICVQSLGVTDTACPIHGNMVEEGDIGDDVSIAQEERGDDRVTATPAAATTTNDNNPGWECKSCVTINLSRNQVCSVCHARRPGASSALQQQQQREMLPATLELTNSAPPAPIWECKSCITLNAAHNEVCSLCGVRKHRAIVDPRVCGLREHGAMRDAREMLPPTLDLTAPVSAAMRDSDEDNNNYDDDANVTNNGKNGNDYANSNSDNINAGQNNHDNGNYANEDRSRNDEEIAHFLSITFSTDASVARQYLEMSFYNMEAAVSLFMDHGGAKEADIGSAVAASMSKDTENALAASMAGDMERALAASLVGDNIESALAASIGDDIQRALAASMGVAAEDQATHVGATRVGAVRVGAMPAAATAGTATRRGQGWECKSCITVNAAQSATCSFCGIRRHGAIRELDIPSATARYEAKLRES